MSKYAILVNPGHNRVYFDAAKKLAISELTVALTNTGVEYSDILGEEIENIYYITFQTAHALKTEELQILASLSFVYAAFEAVIIDESLYLRPLTLPRVDYIDEKISSILKYTGKTNELFTRMMISVARLSSSFSQESLDVFDPIAGKGTTLFEALIAGNNGYGMEINDKVAAESYTYLKKYLETEKIKHTTENIRMNSKDRELAAKKYHVELAKTKEEFKNGTAKRWELVSGNSAYADKFFKKNFFHIIVGDLPYGVQHGNVTAKGQVGSPTRNPKELIITCSEAWYKVLKPGGAMVLAWNSFVLKREEFADILNSAGFQVLNDAVYAQFEHRVDQAIKRDIIVAVKKA